MRQETETVLRWRKVGCSKPVRGKNYMRRDGFWVNSLKKQWSRDVCVLWKNSNVVIYRPHFHAFLKLGEARFVSICAASEIKCLDTNGGLAKEGRNWK